MTKEQLESVLDRVRLWPPELQAEAVNLLLALEAEDDARIDLTPKELADLEEGLAEADRGDFVPEGEVNAFFDKFRR